MSTKHTKAQSNIVWPKTEKAKQAELKDKLETISTVATASQVMAAANSIQMPRARKILNEIAEESRKGTIGKDAANEKEQKKARKNHADKYLAENKAWDEVSGIYLGCKDLIRTGVLIAPLLKEKELIKHVNNIPLLTRLVNSIVTDTKKLSETLNNILKMHDTRSGGAKNPEEMMESYQVFSYYVDFMERYDNTLMPTVVHASEILQEAHFELEKVNPELAKTISVDFGYRLGSIQNSVRDLTGAPKEEVPASSEVAVN